jgi:type I restriction enzyme, S subunit
MSNTTKWSDRTIGTCLVSTSFRNKAQIQARDYQSYGRFPIIDQGQNKVAGWTDTESSVIDSPLPIVIFGDHTRALKFIDFPFARGGDGTQVLVPKNDLDPLFFYYACKFIDVPARGYNRHFGVLKESVFSCPDEKRVQRNIGLSLRLIEDALCRESQRHSLALKLKQATMRELFTCGLRGETQKETEIGLVPESWGAAQLNQLFEIKHGFAFDGASFSAAGEFTLLTPGHFFEGGGFREQSEKTKFFVGEFNDAYLLCEGDLLVVMTEQKAGLLGSSLLIPKSGKYLHNQRLGLVTNIVTAKIAKAYAYHLFNFDLVRGQIARTATGSKVKHTSPGRIGEVIAPVPSIEEQIEIVSILDAIDHKTAIQSKKKSVLEELYRSLLRKLMTGEISVDDLDPSALTPKEP